MNEDLNSWTYLITEACRVYIACLISVNIFTRLIGLQYTFVDISFLAILMTLCMYILKVITGVQKLV